jgi:hypothetical protein
MTNQEFYDKTVRHLLTQRTKSMRTGSSIECLYKNDEDKTCALGCHIPFEKYRPEFEKAGSVRGLLEKETTDVEQRLTSEILNIIGLTEDQYKLAADLQHVHDSHNVIEWPKVLRAVAEDYELNAAIVGEMEKAA